MPRYDWGWGRELGRRPLGYGHQYRDWDAPWGMGGWVGGPRREAGWGFGHGSSSPQFGGYPGGPARGMYYGGPDRYDRGFGEAGAGIDMDDDRIRESVERNIHEDTWLRADRIDVEVNGGVVTLTGTVGDHLEARYAWDDAWETPGVRGVVSRLEVDG